MEGEVAAVRTEFRVRGSMVLALATFLSTSACTELTGSKHQLCPAIEGQFAVEMTPFDVETGDHLYGPLRGAVVDGDYVDSLQASAWQVTDTGLVPGSFSAAWNRPGTYTLTIERDGYRPFSGSGLRAIRDVCGVAPVSIKVELVPE